MILQQNKNQWCDRGSWLQLQMSVVRSSISRSTVDCNSTTFRPWRSSAFCTRPSWSKFCTIAIYCARWNARPHYWHLKPWPWALSDYTWKCQCSTYLFQLCQYLLIHPLIHESFSHIPAHISNDVFIEVFLWDEPASVSHNGNGTALIAFMNSIHCARATI